MSGFKNFVIAGSGSVGTQIIRELLKRKSAGEVDNVTILTRSSSKALDEFTAAGAKTTTVDYTSAESLAAALAGADVVISTLTHVPSALNAQHLLAEQSKAVGVKLFVPSEFGDATDREGAEGIFALKQAVQHKLKELDLPYALFFTGPHSDFVFIAAIGLDIKGGNVTLGGDGNALNSFTTQVDIGRFVAYVLTQVPLSKLQWHIYRIEAERKSFNQIIKEYEERTGKKVNVTYRSVDELQAALEKNPADLATVLQLDWALGGGLIGSEDQLSVSDYPAWNPKTIADVL
ncbi:NAD-P-binding protein [Gloeopeniophorella convolvens]|nr:NAD-P-binding protein [Gloeopeniophorella convolvens]